MVPVSSSTSSSSLPTPSGASPDWSTLWPPLVRGSSKENANEKEEEPKLEFDEREEWSSLAELLRKSGDEGFIDKQTKSNAAWDTQTWLRTSPQSSMARDGGWSTRWKKEAENSPPSSGSLPSSPQSPCPAASKVEEAALESLYIELIRLRLEEEIRLRAAAEVSLRAQQHQRLLLIAQQMVANAQSHDPSSSLHTASKKGPSHSGSLATYEDTAKFGHGKRSELTWQQLQAMVQSRFQQDFSNALFQHRDISTAKAKVMNTFHPQHGPASTASPHSPASAMPRHGAGNRSGMFAVFLNSQGRESGGTGVFIPRRNDEPDNKRRPACSTVLLPTHIVQALNLNIEGTLSSTVSNLATTTSRNREAMIREPLSDRSDGWAHGHSLEQEGTYGVTLPEEWTY